MQVDIAQNRLKVAMEVPNLLEEEVKGSIQSKDSNEMHSHV